MISTVSSQTVLKMIENASHFPPSPLFFVYVEKTFIHKNAKSFWWILINWFPDLSNNFVSYFSGTPGFWSYKCKRSSQVEQLSVHQCGHIHPCLFWVTLSSHIHMNTKHATLAALTCDCAVGSTIHIYKYNGGGLQMWSPFAFAALESGHHLRDFQAVLQ